jgi:MSHA pilin protein MshA
MKHGKREASTHEGHHTTRRKAMKKIRNQKGFTLIELVLVIVVLGILAAFAVPQFVDISSNARTSSVTAMSGAVRSAVALARTQYLINGNPAAVSVSMDGVAVAVTAGTGIPRSTAGGIDEALQDTTGFNVTPGTPATFQPINGGSATCGFTFADVTGAITIDTSGC